MYNNNRLSLQKNFKICSKRSPSMKLASSVASPPCNSTMRMLDIRKYLTSRGWKRDHINFALMQIIARAIYPYSELKTVRYLRENTALAEMFGIEEKILLFDITNSYFEGKIENSELCQYGRSKRKGTIARLWFLLQ